MTDLRSPEKNIGQLQLPASESNHFSSLPSKNVVSTQSMQVDGRPLLYPVEDCYPILIALHLSGESFIHRRGFVEVEGRVLENGFDLDVYIGSALIDMYAKCGSLDRSLLVFFKLREKNLFCWNSVIEGLAVHGYAYEALKMFSRMEREKIKPNVVTFISVLRACTHAGLVEEGLRRFLSMGSDYSIRAAMKYLGVEKSSPGSSWIEMGRKIHQFAASDKTHPAYNEIYLCWLSWMGC
ncbi:pentatricopeptide repeat-containing protein At1g06143-like [Juglans regia]|uniref:Pentatricopeptide repeat-containing protein At1g06143-like n=1 Tax=Juglans regia TaxID=51240 RepID=A0A6P9ECP6_JUGRE|nr:pentatricopeptide repeat-containing protein At1g06143-like [Juglans regia]